MSLRESEAFAPRRKRHKPERALQKTILAWLRSHGCLAAVTDAGAAYRAGSFGADTVPPGWPDITALLPGGRFVGIECKSKRGRQSAVQKRMQRKIRSRGGIYVLARGIEDVQDAIGGANANKL